MGMMSLGAAEHHQEEVLFHEVQPGTAGTGVTPMISILGTRVVASRQ
jgi:hypothetical protein